MTQPELPKSANMPQAPRLRWGVIGTGNFVANYLVPAFRKADGAVLLACAGTSESKAKALAAEHDIARAYAGYDKLLCDADIDAVHIATPDGTHGEIVAAALAAGKHVLCEKPMALTLEEAELMRQACANSDRVTRVGFQIRLQPVMQRVKEIVQSGRLGDIRSITLERSAPVRPTGLSGWRASVETGGVLYGVGIHLLDLVQWFMTRRIDEVFAYANPDRQSGVADQTITIVAKMNDCQAILRATNELPYCRNALNIEGTRGILTTSALRFADRFSLSLTTADGVEREEFNAEDAYVTQMNRFAADVARNGTSLATVDEGFQLVQVTQAVVRALYEYRSIAVWPADHPHR